jgi:hypothetical protein
LALACTELLNKLVGILRFCVLLDPFGDFELLNESIVHILEVRNRDALLLLFVLPVIKDLSKTTVFILLNVALLVHLSKDLVLLGGTRNDLIDLIIIGDLSFLLFFILDVVLSNKIFKALLTLIVTGLVVKHTSLDDLIIE